MTLRGLVHSINHAHHQDRFHVSGWRRWLLIEPFSEGLSLGTCGLILMLTLMIAAAAHLSAQEETAPASTQTTVTVPAPPPAPAESRMNSNLVRNDLSNLLRDRAALALGASL